LVSFTTHNRNTTNTAAASMGKIRISSQNIEVSSVMMVLSTSEFHKPCIVTAVRRATNSIGMALEARR